MDPWKPANFAAYWSYLGEPAAIGTATVIENIVTKDGFFQVVENLFRHLSFFRFILGIAFYDLFFQGINGSVAVAFFLVGCIERCAQAIGVVSLDFSEHFFVELRFDDFALLYIECFVELLLPPTKAINFLVSEH